MTKTQIRTALTTFVSNGLFLGVFMGLSGCVSINSVSLTPIPSQRDNTVRAEVSKTIILGFNFDNDFIDPLVDELKQECPNGVVSGILTKDEITSYVFVHTRRVIATGFCSKQVAKVDSKRSTASETDTGEQ